MRNINDKWKLHLTTVDHISIQIFGDAVFSNKIGDYQTSFFIDLTSHIKTHITINIRQDITTPIFVY